MPPQQSEPVPPTGEQEGITPSSAWKKPILWVLLVLVLIAGGGAYLIGDRQPFELNSEHEGLLEASVYTTPDGVKLLRPPKGWEAVVLKDVLADSKAAVFFKPPMADDPYSPAMQVMYEQWLGSRDESLEDYERYVTAGSANEVISRKEISLGGLSGSLIETRAKDTPNTMRSKYLVLLGSDRSLVVFAMAKESEWSTYGPIFDAAFATVVAQVDAQRGISAADTVAPRENLKKFQSSGFSLSFYYPTDWQCEQDDDFRGLVVCLTPEDVRTMTMVMPASAPAYIDTKYGDFQKLRESVLVGQNSSTITKLVSVSSDGNRGIVEYIFAGSAPGESYSVDATYGTGVEGFYKDFYKTAEDAERVLDAVVKTIAPK